MVDCFVCEEEIPGIDYNISGSSRQDVLLTVYAARNHQYNYFHKDCFELDNLVWYKIGANEISKCAICFCEVAVKPFYSVEVTKLPKVFVDILKDNHYYRVCKDCWYSEIDIPLVSESGA